MDLVKSDELMALISQRRSVGALRQPAPSRDQILNAIEVAMTAPDHRQLVPWRVSILKEEQLSQLGEAFAMALQCDGIACDVDKVKAMPLRAPMVLMVRLKYKAHPKVPHLEQVLSAGAFVQNLLLAIEAIGFHAMWRSGDACFSPSLHRFLGYESDEQLVAMVYVGTKVKDTPPRNAKSVDDIVTPFSLSIE